MEIINVQVGMLKTNCYILKIKDDILIIDPGDEYYKIYDYIKDKHLKGVLITHNHFDHTGALNQILKNYDVKVYDKSNLEERTYKIDEFTFDAIYTPGHTRDSITFYFKEDNIMFDGDFVFKDGIGRCDLPTGDYEQLARSITKIKKYPKCTTLYPGHGDKTTLEDEEKFNEYFRYC